MLLLGRTQPKQPPNLSPRYPVGPAGSGMTLARVGCFSATRASHSSSERQLDAVPGRFLAPGAFGAVSSCPRSSESSGAGSLYAMSAAVTKPCCFGTSNGTRQTNLQTFCQAMLTSGRESSTTGSVSAQDQGQRSNRQTGMFPGWPFPRSEDIQRGFSTRTIPHVPTAIRRCSSSGSFRTRTLMHSRKAFSMPSCVDRAP